MRVHLFIYNSFFLIDSGNHLEATEMEIIYIIMYYSKKILMNGGNHLEDTEIEIISILCNILKFSIRI